MTRALTSAAARLLPYLSKVSERVSGRLELADLAQSVEILHPAEDATQPPVFHDAEELAGVRNTTLFSNLERERRRIAGGAAHHSATKRYEYRNVLATPFGCFRLRGGFNLSGGVPHGLLMTGTVGVYERGFQAPNLMAMRFFGHWLADALPSVLLGRRDEALYMPYPPGWRHAGAYLDALNIERVPETMAFFRRFGFVEDVGQNAGRRARIARIHERIQALTPRSPAKGLYISRGDTGARRRLSNEAELIAALKARGVAAVGATDPLEDLWAAGGQVDLTVSVEGSHAANGLFTARRGALHVMICPTDHLSAVYSDYMPAFGGRLAIAIADRDGEDYRVDVPRLMALIDRARAAMGLPALP